VIITYQGDNYFKLTSGETVLLVDPKDQRSFRGANVVINTRRPAEVESPSEKENVFWIDHAGEYEVSGIRIQGMQSFSLKFEKTIYLLEFENTKILVLGFLEESPKDEIQEHLTDIDIVITPVGNGENTIKSFELAKFIRQLEPALIIPSTAGDLKKFLKEFSKEECKEEEKIVLRKNDLEEGKMEIRCLKK
jgi:L-ascorbate metabolism protein UlaG (beta-lactamase superfamily)